MKDDKAGSIFVVTRYAGVGSGWNVAFLHRDAKQEWLGFFLTHEAFFWRNVQLQRESNHVFVIQGGRRVGGV